MSQTTYLTSCPTFFLENRHSLSALQLWANTILSDAMMAHHFLSSTAARTQVLSLIPSYSGLPVVFLDFLPASTTWKFTY